MGEDDIVELIWKSGQIVRHSQTQTPSVTPPTTILRGSGSGGGDEEGEGNAPLPPLPPLPQPPPLMTHQQPSDQNLFIREDEMASWLHHPLREDEFGSHLFYSGVVVPIPFTQPQGSVSLTPPPPLSPSALYTPTAERPMGRLIAATRPENFSNFSRLRGNIYTGGTVEATGPWIPMVRDSTQVGSSAIDSCLTPATVTGVVSQTFALPGLSQKAIETVCEIGGPSFSQVETEPIQIQPATTETETADERKRKEREETADETNETEEARGSTSRKRSRAAEMHNIAERRRREKINERIKALQELIPRCNKTDKASVLDDAIEYMKLLQMQIQMMMGGGGMMPMMQRFMPRMGTGMMSMNRPPFIPFPGTPFPRPAHMALAPPYPGPRYPFPNIQAFHPSRVHLPSQQPFLNQPQFPGYLNPYSQFVGLQQMQQPPPPQMRQPPPPPLQRSSSQASSSEEHEEQDNQPTG